MVRSYILIETEMDKPQEFIATVGGDLPSCKGLAESFVSGEVVVYLHCNDLDAMNKSIMRIAEKDGVKQITTLHVKTF